MSNKKPHPKSAQLGPTPNTAGVPVGPAPEPATELRFNIEEVRALVEYSLNCKQHSPTFGQLFDPAIAKEGVVLKEDQYLQKDQVDKSKVPAALSWVKDEGSYLMSNGIPRLLKDPKDPNSMAQVVYAKGFGPDADHDHVRHALGGDDFVECLKLNDDLVRSIRECKDGALVLMVTASSIDVFVEMAPKASLKQKR
jgi:Protein of unknown function (DUF3085)